MQIMPFLLYIGQTVKNPPIWMAFGKSRLFIGWLTLPSPYWSHVYKQAAAHWSFSGLSWKMTRKLAFLLVGVRRFLNPIGCCCRLKVENLSSRVSWRIIARKLSFRLVGVRRFLIPIGCCRLKVENLSSRVSWQDLKDTLRRGGDVTFAEAHTVS